MKRQTPNNDWFGFSGTCSTFYLPSVADRYYSELDGVRKLSSGSNELLRESLLVEGAPWQLHKLSSLFLLLFVLDLSFIQFLLPSALSLLVLVLLLPLCPPFSVSIDLPLWRENMVLIRHLAEPVFFGQTLLKTPLIYSELLFKPCLYISGIRSDFLIADSYTVSPAEVLALSLKDAFVLQLPQILYFSLQPVSAASCFHKLPFPLMRNIISNKMVILFQMSSPEPGNPQQRHLKE